MSIFTILYCLLYIKVISHSYQLSQLYIVRHFDMLTYNQRQPFYSINIFFYITISSSLLMN